MKRHFSRVVLVLAAIGVAALAGAVTYAIAGTGGGTINACYGPNGQLRLLDPTDGCRPSETAISWNQTGPVGPQGPAGRSSIHRTVSGTRPTG